MATACGLSICLSILLLCLSAPAQALSVDKSAAVGIGVGLGVVCFLAISGGLLLYFYKKRPREEHGDIELDGQTLAPELTKEEAIAAHRRDMQAKNFNIWAERAPPIKR